MRLADSIIVAIVALWAGTVEGASFPRRVQALAVDPGDSTIVYAGTEMGLYKTTDAGESWTRIDANFPWTDVTAVAIDPTAPCTVYAGLDSHLFGLSRIIPVPTFTPDNTSNILMVSSDCGATWGLARNRTGRAVNKLAFTSATPPLLLARVTVNTSSAGIPFLVEDIVRFAPTATDVVLSNGTGFYALGVQSILATDAADPCVFYVATDSLGFLWKTSDCGSTLSTFAAPQSGNQVHVKSIAVHPTDHSLLVGTSELALGCCGFGGAIYRKTNASGWTAVLVKPPSADGSPIYAIAFAPGNGRVAYAADADTIYKSIDGGVTWYPTRRLHATVIAVGSTPVLRGYAGGSTFAADPQSVSQFGCHVGVDNSAATGAPDCAFTDAVLTPLATTIKATHITELRARIEALRTRYGLPAVVWSDPSLTVGVTPIRAQHLLELRAALGDVYQAAGQSAPEYTDPDLGVGTVAKSAHVDELRRAVEALE